MAEGRAGALGTPTDANGELVGIITHSDPMKTMERPRVRMLQEEHVRERGRR
jgi:hypothetical protein